MTDDKTKDKKKVQELLASPMQIVPKFSNGVNFSALNNGQVVITSTYKEGDQPPILIDRIIVDVEHAKKIRDVLTDFLVEIDKKNDTSTT